MSILPPGELEVVRLLASGLTNAEIAAKRVTSVHTIKHQIRNARIRLGARTTFELVAMVVREDACTNPPDGV